MSCEPWMPGVVSFVVIIDPSLARGSQKKPGRLQSGGNVAMWEIEAGSWELGAGNWIAPDPVRGLSWSGMAGVVAPRPDHETRLEAMRTCPGDGAATTNTERREETSTDEGEDEGGVEAKAKAVTRRESSPRARDQESGTKWTRRRGDDARRKLIPCPKSRCLHAGGRRIF